MDDKMATPDQPALMAAQEAERMHMLHVQTSTGDPFFDYGSRPSRRDGEPSGPRSRMESCLAVLAFLGCLGFFWSMASAVNSSRLDCPWHQRQPFVHGADDVANVEPTNRPSGFHEIVLPGASREYLEELVGQDLPEESQHGIKESEDEALEAVHSDQPESTEEVASLAKRQEDVGAGNGSPAGDNSTTPAKSPTTSPSGMKTSTTSSSPPPHTTTSSSTSKAPTTTPEKPTTSTTTSTPPPPPTTSSTSSTSSTPKTTTSSSGMSSTSVKTSSTTSSSSSSTSSSSSSTSSAPPRTSTTSTSPPDKPSSSISSMSFVSSSSSSFSSSSSSSFTSSPHPHTRSPTSTLVSQEVPKSTSEKHTITHGSKTTSSAVHHTFTTTLGDGGTITITSTSWVAVVPTAAASSKKKPGLQNDAAHPRGNAGGLFAGVAALAAGLFMV